MTDRDVVRPVPGWVWWGTLTGVGLVCAITVGGAILLARGAADPPVAGPVVWADTTLDWASGPGAALAAGQAEWFAAPEAARLPDNTFTLSVSARIEAESDPSAAWGVWIETADGDRVVYAISGEGYTTTRQCGASAFSHQLSAISTNATPGDSVQIEDCPALRPEWRWMPYVRIKPPGTTNTITLHHEGAGEVRLRINREILGRAQIAWTGRWGIWWRGGRAGGASLFFENAAVRGS